MTETERPDPSAQDPGDRPAEATDRAYGADDFSRLALEMHEAEGVEETIEAVVEFAIQALNCAYAGVALRTSAGGLEIPAVTDPVVADIYEFQSAGGDGPLMLCMEERATVLVPDLVQDARWLDWAKKVLELGVRSVLDVPLWTSSGPVGVLGLYSKQPDAFGPDEIAVAYILARHAAVALATARREEHLKVAVDARKLVGQAMGILMERYSLDSDQAFQVLRRYSQDTNTKLREVAQQLIDSRRLPPT
ncbi:MAG: GAF and ANTAR domain-containing protein [Kribbellaceae bacterium]|nr:GAF and ANTAR domain-containing protein [Kribbellaceae bacterium]